MSTTFTPSTKVHCNLDSQHRYQKVCEDDTLTRRVDRD